MPTITLSVSDLNTQTFPPVCIICGMPATSAYPRILTPVVGESSNKSAPGAQVQFAAPLCPQHGHVQFNLSAAANLLLFGGIVLLFGGMVLAPITNEPYWAGLSVLGLVPIIAVRVAMRPAISARINAWPNPSRITLMGVSPAFAAGMGNSAQRVASPPNSARRQTGSALTAFGTGLAVVSGFLVSAMLYAQINSPDAAQNVGPYALLILIASIGGAAGVLMRRAGKRLAMPSVAELLAADSRPPILYLRAFDDDEAGHRAEIAVPGLGGQQLPSGFGTSLEQITFEELLATELSWLGPVVAIGRPGDSRALPRVGAARMWVKDTEWQESVRGFLPRARMVVLLMGRIQREKGLAWEWAQLQAAVPPEQIMLIMPPVDPAEARQRWAGFEQRAAGRLPPYREGIVAVRFSRAWECRLFMAAKPIANPNEYRAAVAATDPGAGWVVASPVSD